MAKDEDLSFALSRGIAWGAPDDQPKEEVADREAVPADDTEPEVRIETMVFDPFTHRKLLTWSARRLTHALLIRQARLRPHRAEVREVDPATDGGEDSASDARGQELRDLRGPVRCEQSPTPDELVRER
jgi:hypothetical protein